jgi:hypothetical protein
MMPKASAQPRTGRHRQGIALFLAMTCATALPQSAPSPSTRASTSGLYRIAGTVVNAVTGEPVRRAAVAVLAEEDSHTVESVESDNDGHFSLERLPATKYQLTASHRGFRTAFYDEHDEFNSAIVTGPDQDTGHLTFRLTPGSVLRGVVTADGGDPVQGARVLLFLKPRGHNPDDRIVQVNTDATDDTGAYEFNNLAPGDYLVAVQAVPWYALHHAGSDARPKPASDPSAALDVAYPVTYFDSTDDEAAATPIVLTGGSREQADIVLHVVPALHLSMPLSRNPQDQRISPPSAIRQSIFGTQLPSDYFVSWAAARQGVIEFTGMAPGRYELALDNPPRTMELDATTSQQLDPTLGTPTLTVAGTLQTSSGSPPPDQAILTLESVDGIQHRNPVQTTAVKGAFTFPSSVPPGAWQLEVVGAGASLPVASISVAGRAHAGNLLTVRDRPLSVVVTVSLGASRVQGFARKDGKGLAGAMIILAPRNAAAFRSLVRRDQSDSDGSFSLRDVVPGQYTLVAIEDAWELDWARPEVLARYLPSGIPVTVTDGSGKVVRISEPVPVQSR